LDAYSINQKEKALGIQFSADQRGMLSLLELMLLLVFVIFIRHTTIETRGLKFRRKRSKERVERAHTKRQSIWSALGNV
jgi:hypothetical protein